MSLSFKLKNEEKQTIKDFVDYFVILFFFFILLT